MNAPTNIRLCRDDEFQSILMIVNAAAEAYRGAIPEDCWHDPYMPADELRSEIATGVVFWGYEVDGILVGVMGIQPVRDVDLIHHVLRGEQDEKRTSIRMRECSRMRDEGRA